MLWDASPIKWYRRLLNALDNKNYVGPKEIKIHAHIIHQLVSTLENCRHFYVFLPQLTNRNWHKLRVLQKNTTERKKLSEKETRKDICNRNCKEIDLNNQSTFRLVSYLCAAADKSIDCLNAIPKHKLFKKGLSPTDDHMWASDVTCLRVDQCQIWIQVLNPDSGLLNPLCYNYQQVHT